MTNSLQRLTAPAPTLILETELYLAFRYW